MAIITRSNIAKELVPGLRKIVGLEYTRYPSQYEDLFESKTSEKAFEEDVLMGQLGLAVTKPEGASVTFDTMQETYTSRYTHEVVALGFQITQEAIDDNLYVDYAKKYASSLGFSLAQTKNIKGANVFNNGFDPAYPGGDGVPLFSASHPTLNAGNLSNLVSGGADLSETALKNAWIAISKFQDTRGLKIMAMPQSLHIPAALNFDAFEILRSDLSTTTATNSTTGITNINNVNSIKAQGIFPKGMYINNYFTDEDAWFIRTNVPDGTILFQRKPLAFGQDRDSYTDNLMFKGSERYSFGWTDWRQWYGSAGAG